MSIINRKILLKPVSLSGTTSGVTVINDYINIKLELGSDDGFIGYQQEIDNLTSFTSIGLINPVTDGEKRKYKRKPSALAILSFLFYNGSTWVSTFEAAGFTQDEYKKNSDNFLNSFFILDFYDTYDINNQTKLFTTYLTKKGNTTPTYTISDSNNQLYYMYIPESYISGQTGTITGYTKFMFYNAKTGKVATFLNQENASSNNANRIFFEIELNHADRTWKYIKSPTQMTAKEIVNNSEYADKVNNTVDTIDILQQNPPSGDTFVYINGKTNYLIM
jgi:hypothetical protein